MSRRCNSAPLVHLIVVLSRKGEEIKKKQRLKGENKKQERREK